MLGVGDGAITKKRRRSRRFAYQRSKKETRPAIKLHPLFIGVGIWYSITGELPLFLMSCFVALQHECAHAFAAARLGYKLNAVVLMPYGAVIDGDLSSMRLKDELSVVLAGPICNLLTAALFAAIWWFAPTMYAFTDTAYSTSLAIALVNLLPAYPLDGGRALRVILTQAFTKKQTDEGKAEKQAIKICQTITLILAVGMASVFVFGAVKKQVNISLLFFAIFLAFGAFGNGEKYAHYQKVDFSCADALARGLEIRRVAVWNGCVIKDVFKYVSKGRYLVLEVYDSEEKHLFNLSQNQLSLLFLQAKTPYETLQTLKNRQNNTKKG